MTKNNENYGSEPQSERQLKLVAQWNHAAKVGKFLYLCGLELRILELRIEDRIFLLILLLVCYPKNNL
jgi:hypothetical protein